MLLFCCVGFTNKLSPLVDVTGGKRRGNSSSVTDSDDAKRSRVSTATGGPQSAGSSSSLSPQPPLLRPTPHRSPVIKYNLLPYNIGQFSFSFFFHIGVLITYNTLSHSRPTYYRWSHSCRWSDAGATGHTHLVNPDSYSLHYSQHDWHRRNRPSLSSPRPCTSHAP